MTEEMIAKAREAQSAEELLALAKKNGMEMTEKEAADLYERLHSSTELADEELENVAGGCGSSTASSDTVTVDGVSYKKVSGHTACFTGKFKKTTVPKCGKPALTDEEVCGNCLRCMLDPSCHDWSSDAWYCSVC